MVTDYLSALPWSPPVWLRPPTPSEAQACRSEGLLISVVPAYPEGSFCVLGRCWNQIVADQPESQTASGLWKHCPQTRDWSDMGVGAGGTLPHTSGINQPHSPNPLGLQPSLPLPLAPLHSGTETQGPTSKEALSFPSHCLCLLSDVTCLCTTGNFPISYPTHLVPLMPSCTTSLVTLLPWLLNLLNPALRFIILAPSHCLLILWPRSREHPVRASLTACGCKLWGLSVPLEAPPEEEPRTSLRPRDGHRGSLLLAADG